MDSYYYVPSHILTNRLSRFTYVPNLNFMLLFLYKEIIAFTSKLICLKLLLTILSLLFIQGITQTRPVWSPQPSLLTWGARWTNGPYLPTRPLVWKRPVAYRHTLLPSYLGEFWNHYQDSEQSVSTQKSLVQYSVAQASWSTDRAISQILISCHSFHRHLGIWLLSSKTRVETF